MSRRKLTLYLLFLLTSSFISTEFTSNLQTSENIIPLSASIRTVNLSAGISTIWENVGGVYQNVNRKATANLNLEEESNSIKVTCTKIDSPGGVTEVYVNVQDASGIITRYNLTLNVEKIFEHGYRNYIFEYILVFTYTYTGCVDASGSYCTGTTQRTAIGSDSEKFNGIQPTVAPLLNTSFVRGFAAENPDTYRYETAQFICFGFEETIIPDGDVSIFYMKGKKTTESFSEPIFLKKMTPENESYLDENNVLRWTYLVKVSEYERKDLFNGYTVGICYENDFNERSPFKLFIIDNPGVFIDFYMNIGFYTSMVFIIALSVYYSKNIKRISS